MTNIYSQYNNDGIWRERNSKKNVLCRKKTIEIWDINVDNIVISKLTETKTNSKYLIGIKFDKPIR